MVGGGVRDHLLCQLTADACGLPVIAGPVEAAALGNALAQARALGAAPGDLAACAPWWRTRRSCAGSSPAETRGHGRPRPGGYGDRAVLITAG
jgi:rhamnulokinase